MKKYYCMCDIGSVLIGDENWTFAVPNIGGDGETEIRVYNNETEFSSDEFVKNMRFVSSVQGRFGIYDYDCAYNGLHSGRMTIDDSMVILNGRYGIYNGEYMVAFVKWKI